MHEAFFTSQEATQFDDLNEALVRNRSQGLVREKEAFRSCFTCSEVSAEFKALQNDSQSLTGCFNTNDSPKESPLVRLY